VNVDCKSDLLKMFWVSFETIIFFIKFSLILILFNNILVTLRFKFVCSGGCCVNRPLIQTHSCFEFLFFRKEEQNQILEIGFDFLNKNCRTINICNLSNYDKFHKENFDYFQFSIVQSS
jgi:hypothetical protein